MVGKGWREKYLFAKIYILRYTGGSRHTKDTVLHMVGKGWREIYSCFTGTYVIQPTHHTLAALSTSLVQSNAKQMSAPSRKEILVFRYGAKLIRFLLFSSLTNTFSDI